MTSASNDLETVLKICREHCPEHNVSKDTALISSGLLDSFGIFDLISKIESSFNMQLPSENMIVEKLDTPQLIANLIQNEKRDM